MSSTKAKFIKIIYDYRSKSVFNQRWNLHLLKDDNGDVIMGMAYLNAGRKIADIPDFLDIKYVNDDLKNISYQNSKSQERS